MVQYILNLLIIINMFDLSNISTVCDEDFITEEAIEIVSAIDKMDEGADFVFFPSGIEQSSLNFNISEDSNAYIEFFIDGKGSLTSLDERQMNGLSVEGVSFYDEDKGFSKEFASFIGYEGEDVFLDNLNVLIHNIAKAFYVQDINMSKLYFFSVAYSQYNLNINWHRDGGGFYNYKDKYEDIHRPLRVLCAFEGDGTIFYPKEHLDSKAVFYGDYQSEEFYGFYSEIYGYESQENSYFEGLNTNFDPDKVVFMPQNNCVMFSMSAGDGAVHSVPQGDGNNRFIILIEF